MTDWVAVGDGTCRSPCHVVGDDGAEECWPSSNVNSDLDLPDGCMTDPTTNYCICDIDNGWITDGAGGCRAACLVDG